MAGDALFSPSPDPFRCEGYEDLLQPILRQGTAFCSPGRKPWPFPEEGYSRMDEEKMVSLWFFELFPYDVCFDAVEYLPGPCRSGELENSSKPFVGI